jgi:Ti-type conjugative transfer relaxase TraA
VKRDLNIDVRADLQRRLLAAIGEGEAPWDLAESWDLPHVLPFNAATQLPYSGGNALSLILAQRNRGGDPRWLSLDQAKAAGFEPAADAEAVPLEFWSRENGGLRSNVVPVFNAAQLHNDSGMSFAEAVALERGHLRVDPIERAEQILGASGVRIEHVAGTERPHYDADTDTIVMPTRDKFEDASSYYQAALGPLATASAIAAGAPADQLLYRTQLAKVMIAIETGIVVDEPGLSREAWAEAIGKNKNFAYQASRDAGRIADYVIGLAPERTLAQEQVLASGLKLITEPQIALRELTDGQSTFSRKELERYVRTHTADTRQFAELMNAIASSPDLVQLDRNGSRFTSSEIFEIERTLIRVGDILARSDRPGVDPERVERVLENSVLGDQQRAALRHITGGGSLANVIGYAGTGKSKMLGDARAVWESSGNYVRGTALSGIAAEGLEEGSGIPSRTIASLKLAWENGRDELKKNDVLVVDEAGMVGSRDMALLETKVAEAGAKLVLVGDYKQLQSIEAGAAFRALIDRHGAARISEIRRQVDEWARAASIDFAEGRIDQAVAAYERHDNVHKTRSLEEAKAELVDRWARTREQYPEQTQIILAFTRKDVSDLNDRARGVMRAAGQLGPDLEIATAFGPLDLATGDRIYFRKNEKNLGVKNGSLGTILEIDQEQLRVKLDAGRIVDFKLEDYNSLSRGLAATVHRSQGVTVDRAHFLVTPLVDMNLSYVAMTRQRLEANMYYATDQIRDRRTLVDVLGREGDKDTSADYELRASRELAMKELVLRAQEDVALEREGGRLGATERDMRELIAIAHASGREGDAIKPTLPVRLADALGVVLDGDAEAATGLLVAENARGHAVGTFGELATWLRDEQARSDGDPLSRDLAENLASVIDRRPDQLKALLAVQTPVFARHAARDVLARDANVGPDPAGADPKDISVRIVDTRSVTHRGAALLQSEHPLEIATGLLAVTGRRPIEILKTAKFELTDDPFVVRFSGQAKSIELKPTNIPTLVEAERVVAALGKLRERLDLSNVDNTIVNRQTAKQMSQLVRRHYSEELVPKDLRNVYLADAYATLKPEKTIWSYAAEILAHDPLDVRTGLSYTKFAGDREAVALHLEESRKDANGLLRDAIATEQDPQMRSFLRERLVELGATRWDVSDADVKLHQGQRVEQTRDVAIVKGRVTSIGEAARSAAGETSVHFTVEVTDKGATRNVDVDVRGTLAEATLKDLKVGQNVRLTGEQLAAGDLGKTKFQELRLLEPVRIQQERALAAAERLVVGWYRSPKAEQFPMAQGALLNVPAGEYAIIAERIGDRFEKLGIEMHGRVSRVGQRTDLAEGMERGARRPITEAQVIALSNGADAKIRLEPAIAQVQNNDLRVANGLAALERVPLAKGTLGVTYDGPLLRADGNHVVQRLSNGDLVRHAAKALDRDRVSLGKREAISYSNGHGKMRDREKSQSHDLSHKAQ